MPGNETHVIQVTNVSPAVTKDQLKSFFNYIGKIEDIKLYPELEAIDVSTRVCYVKYKDSEDVGVALHLTNTAFVDRALIVVPVADDKIPDELTALGIVSSDGLTTSNMYQGLTQYPVLPSNTDLSRVEEIRRTVYVSNVECSVTPEFLIQFFTQAGEVKYMRMAGEESLSVRSAFVEYSDQNSVIKALGLNGHSLHGHQISVTPSNTAIVKPPMMHGVSATTKEIEEAMKKVSEAESLISAVADPLTNGRGRSSHRSRSRRTRSRRRSRSRGSPRRRSRSRTRHRSRSHRRSRKSRSRSKRSKSRYSRSRSRDRKRDKDKPSSRSKVSTNEKKSDDHKSRRSGQSKDSSSKYEREGSRHSRESRSRSVKKKSSKRKSGSTSRRSPSRSESRKAKKSHLNDDNKSSKDEKDSHKRKHESVSERHSRKNSSSRRKHKIEEKSVAVDPSEPCGNPKICGDDEGSKNLHKNDSNCSQMDMDVDSD